jgi:hypothetical protein
MIMRQLPNRHRRPRADILLTNRHLRDALPAKESIMAVAYDSIRIRSGVNFSAICRPRLSQSA